MDGILRILIFKWYNVKIWNHLYKWILLFYIRARKSTLLMLGKQYFEFKNNKSFATAATSFVKIRSLSLMYTTYQIELRTRRITSGDVKSVHNNLSNNGNNMDHVSIERQILMHGNVYANKIKTTEKLFFWNLISYLYIRKAEKSILSFDIMFGFFSFFLIFCLSSGIIHSSKVLLFFNWIFNRQELNMLYVQFSREKSILCVKLKQNERGVRT